MVARIGRPPRNPCASDHAHPQGPSSELQVPQPSSGNRCSDNVGTLDCNRSYQENMPHQMEMVQRFRWVDVRRIPSHVHAEQVLAVSLRKCLYYAIRQECGHRWRAPSPLGPESRCFRSPPKLCIQGYRPAIDDHDVPLPLTRPIMYPSFQSF